MSWFVYVLECSDSTLYTGTTNDINRRVQQHNDKVGAKYTMYRTPVKLLVTWSYPDRSIACSEEYKFKCLSRDKKLIEIENKMLIDEHVRSITNGTITNSPEELQFYDNNKEEIEKELLLIFNKEQK